MTPEARRLRRKQRYWTDPAFRREHLAWCRDAKHKPKKRSTQLMQGAGRHGISRRNPMAEDLRSEKYRQRIVRSRKAYDRKQAHDDA
jgi:hypothetical protein